MDNSLFLFSHQLNDKSAATRTVVKIDEHHLLPGAQA
jgi:hypothetical protein